MFGIHITIDTPSALAGLNKAAVVKRPDPKPVGGPTPAVRAILAGRHPVHHPNAPRPTAESRYQQRMSGGKPFLRNYKKQVALAEQPVSGF